LNPDPGPGLSVVIPAYNEEEAVSGVVDRVQAALAKSGLPHEIIVVDDGSEDRTAQVLEGKAVRLLQHGVNRGYGAALKTGIRAARYRHVAILDADGTYEEEAILRLMEHMTDFDMVVGARTDGLDNIPPARRPAKWALGRLADFLAETRIPDLNSGFRIFDKEIAEEFFQILPSKFSFTTTITMAMLTNGYSVKFVPTNYRKRKGDSKIRPVRDTVNFFSLLVRTAVYFAPLKVFMPLSFFFIGLGLLKMIVLDVLIIQNVTDTTILFIVAGIQIGMLGLLADLIDKRSIPRGKGGRK